MKVRWLLFFVVLFSVLSLPAHAAYEWKNEITVKTDSMTWAYTEKYSGDSSKVYRTLIDIELGDNDDFISSWELLKTDVKSRQAFFGSLEENMDVEIDNSSENVTFLRVESEISDEIIGPVDEYKVIVNRYKVFYDFKTPLTESGSSMWFMGEPESEVSLHLPSEMTLISVEGIDRKSTKEDSDGTTISGKFGLTGEITIHFSVEEPPVQDAEEDVVETPDNTSTTGATSLIDRIFPGLTDRLLEKLKFDTFNIS